MSCYFLVKNYELPVLKLGDILTFHHTGAYCMSEGIALFLSRELPSVGILDENDNFTIVRNQIATEIFNTPHKI